MEEEKGLWKDLKFKEVSTLLLEYIAKFAYGWSKYEKSTHPAPYFPRSWKGFVQLDRVGEFCISHEKA